jgi:pimeloyl-ACP methyl ester carboxylesterase
MRFMGTGTTQSFLPHRQNDRIWSIYFGSRPKLRQRLRRLAVPTLLLWGGDDRFVTADYYGTAFRDAIPGARLEIVHGAGHFPHLEEPEALAERIRAFALE